MPELMTFEALLALLTLTSLEIVLGIDNIVFIVVITGRMDPRHRDRARKWGIGLAMFTRILLLLGITWVMRLTAPLFQLPVLEHTVTGKDLVLLLGGLFLLAKATLEIHEKTTGNPTEHAAAEKAAASMGSAIAQIVALDVIFSLDSVITAVGMSRHIEIMIAAVVISVVIMLIFSGPVSNFVNKHPTVQMLAFSFLLLVGVFLVAEGLGRHIDRGYIYFAMFFSLFVEFMNLRMRRIGKA
ncbi:membrane protein TerC, possibly involved in tellurium resistance [Desulfocurvibacter africanus PCS]|uniref:Membrane protein TerC, possibly involved in tellurium resistance n=1 Tax=Desulfocurvibacter africanus PCS TaxID=1262666 RepID=M5PNI2_DESAF|nr:TerC family protein [Desulfocurvibacter africanus]EMG35682.1 membrane protein TerC, possibly involved in tellurium resistance [Desulfocurvibacter africanus PCS]